MWYELNICTTGISKAFLQGVIYKYLAEGARAPLREVNFVRPGYCVPILRLMLGYEDFGFTQEALHCEKPGVGCNDAPRCFSLKLAMVTQSKCKMKPSTVDPEPCMRHDQVNGKSTLVTLLAKSADDLNMTGYADKLYFT